MPVQTGASGGGRPSRPLGRRRLGGSAVGSPGIGQGFADEIFGVLARAHPEIALEPIHMNEDTRFFVERARRAP